MLVENEVRSALEQAKNPSPNLKPLLLSDWIVIAVSGGPDSLALLHLMVMKGYHQSDRIVVAHINHSLRPEADSEAAAVSDIAAEWGLKFQELKLDVSAIAHDQGLTLEEAGRKVRYDFLAAVADQFNAKVVMTGHNANDQTETILMHILRGSGLSGLRGMSAITPLPGHANISLVRPLLNTTRAEIESYCRENRLEPATDESNLDTRLERNWIRHRLLPAIEDRHPQFDKKLRQLADLVRADYGFLRETQTAYVESIVMGRGESWLSYDLSKWRRMPLALKRASIRIAFAELQEESIEIGFQSVESARQVVESGHVGQSADLPGGVKMQIDYLSLRFSKSPDNRPFAVTPQLKDLAPITLVIPGSVDLEGGWKLVCEPIESFDLDAIKNNPDPWTAYIDGIGLEQLTVRPPGVGENFRPLGMAGHHAKLSDVMVNRKIPAELRKLWPIVSKEGQLLWIVGHQIDDRAKVTTETKQVIRLEVRRPGSV